MITKEIQETAELWFDDIRIRATKINGIPTGDVVANGGFIIPTQGNLLVRQVGIAEDVNTFLSSVATKLSLDPAVLYQAICDSLEDAYTATLPVIP